MLDICGIKFYTDGALGSNGAALLEPYDDTKDFKGLMLLTENELFEKCKKGIEKGFSIATHYIGDAASRLVLNTYKKLFDLKIHQNYPPIRVEHIQMLKPEDLRLFENYQIISSVQPIHCLSDYNMAPKKIGERCSYSYRWKSLINAGSKVIAGSDLPIEYHNPLLGIDAFIKRKPKNADKSWYPEEIISPQEALEAYTKSPQEIFQNNNRGEVKVGNYADFTILDKDITLNQEIVKAKVLATICGGEVIYLDNQI